MLNLRSDRPCEKCVGLPFCEFVRRELEQTVTRVNDVSVFAGYRSPDLEIVLICRLFNPRRPAHK